MIKLQTTKLTTSTSTQLVVKLTPTTNILLLSYIRNKLNQLQRMFCRIAVVGFTDGIFSFVSNLLELAADLSAKWASL